VVGTMVSRPPADGALDGAAAHSCQEQLEGSGRRVRAVSPQPVIAWEETLA
jgi:hypothetical protein